MKKLLAVLMAFMLVVLAACSSDEAGSSGKGSGGGGGGAEGAPRDMAFGSATVGGFWYTLSGAMGEKMKEVYPESSVTVVEGGSVSNLLGLSQGTFALGFSNGQTVPEALNGINAFKEKVDNVSTVATLYPNVFQIVVRADSDIKSVKDLKGKKVSPGIKGYSGELAFLDILKLNDMSYDDLGGIEYIGTADGADLLRDGHIDAIVGMVSAPVSTFQELDTTLGIRLIPLDDETVKGLHELNEGYLEYDIEGGTYSNVKEDVKTVAGYTVLLVNDDLMDEESVYKLTKMMVEEKDTWTTLSPIMKDFNAEYSVQNNVGKLHPGAEKYYKEVGALK
ncbi:TAXI family TRAP transporter solute-binding subunit [Cytobacillus firmus]|uniref:TAXI family TRAP transporter solute-binding subunit n=1 Tax=Cytobacillus firmus TaxID=1399 RepID=UPI00202F924C|nr:TAXI family TRAP transporter solute-binding subunit [Cytobacillus firmus]URT70634.1 TAXI family TRAP transporter solute-binding subunit [Cytobacillus firmus]WHY61550.1 TAXI family TRAP transporter solute-binding subunit [Cytobacillus firmus]